MKPRNLLWLAIAVVALGLLIFFEQESPSTDERKAQAEKIVLFEAEEVQGLSWTWDDNKVALVRELSEEGDVDGSASWRLTDPYRARADDRAVNSLLSSIVDWQRESRIEGADRSEIGLEAPRAELRMETSRGNTIVRFGAPLPVGQAMVVEVEGDAPVVVSDTLWKDLSKSPGDWRSKQIFWASRDDIGRIRVEMTDFALQIASREQVYWLDEPVVDLANQDLVRALISSVTGLRAESFVDNEAILAEAGLAPAIATVEVIFDGPEGSGDSEKSWLLELGAEVAGSEGQIYARAENQVFVTGKDLLDAVARPVESWRNLDLTTFDSWQIESIEIDDGQEMILLEKMGVDWLRNGMRIEGSWVEDLLGWLTETRAESVQDKGSPMGKAAMVCKLRDRDAREQEVSFFETGQGDLAGTTVREAILNLPAGSVRQLREKLASLASAESRPVEELPETPSGDLSD